MQIRILGPIEVWDSGESLPLGGPKQRAVLAMLALHANRVVSLPALIGGLWGDRSTDHALNDLQVYVSRIRRALVRDASTGIVVRRQGPGYRLEVPTDQVDLIAFDRLAESGRAQIATAPHAAAALLREALDLWRGPALAEFAGLPFAEPEITRLAHLHDAAVLARIDADLALGRHRELLAELDLLTQRDPLNEPLHHRFVLALYRADRQADALDAYHRLRVRIADELGTAPGRPLQDLERAVLVHDGRLDWRPVPQSRPRIPSQRPLTRPATTPGPVPATRHATTGPVPATREARRRPDAWNVPARNPHFTGRTAILDQVARRLVRGEHTLIVQALYGLGGVGKSQLAIEFAHRFAHLYRLVRWIDAEQPLLIGEQIARLAPFLDLPARASVEATVQQVLGDLAVRDGWLLIFDNADRPGDLAPFRPAGAGHIMVTSRSPGWGELGGRIPVDVLDRAETIDLLRSRIDVDDEVAADLAAELGDLPLAVAQAIAHIEQSGMGAGDYLRHFSTRRSALLARGEVLGYGGRVDTAWNISFDRLRTRAPAALALLTYCAFLGPEPIPQDLFTPGLPALAERAGQDGADPLVLSDAIGAAAALSLLRRDPGGFQLHRLVQAVIRSHLSPEDRERALADVVGLLAQAHPGDPNDPANWSRYAALVPHLLAVGAAADLHPGARRLMLDTIVYFNTTANTRAGRSVATDVHERWRTRLGAGHEDTLSLAGSLTLALLWDGAAQAAGRLGTDSLARARRALGADHMLSLRLAAYLCCARAWLADSAGAADLAADTLDRIDRSLPPDDHDRLRLGAYLALALAWVGRPDAADVAARVHDRAREVLGPDHPTALLAGTALALGLLTGDDVARTRDVALETMRRAREVLGERHLATLGASSVLTIALLWSGDPTAATRVGGQLVAAAQPLLDSDHVVALMAIAAVAAIKAETPAAEIDLDIPAAATRAAALLGPDHPITLVTAVAAASAVAASSAVAAGSAGPVVADVRDRVARTFASAHPLLRRLPAGP